MSEMTALEYLKARARMTDDCSINCEECPLYVSYGIFTCIDSYAQKYEKAIEIVEKWAKENPIKTYKDVFFEKFPNAQKDEEGYPIIFVNNIFGEKAIIKGMSDNDNWNQKYKEE